MKLGALPIYIIDTETTGLSAPEDTLCEIALIRWFPPNYTGPLQRTEWSSLVNPGRHIPEEASNIHGIKNEHVVGAPTVAEAQATIQRIIPSESLVLAHNMAFDAKFINLTEYHLGCTLRLAQYLWPQAPSYKNENLANWLGIAKPEGRLHRALNDVQLTSKVFYVILKHLVNKIGHVPSAEELISFSSMDAPITAIPFGKYKGVSIKDVPTDYLEYALKKWNDAESALLKALRSELEQRGIRFT